MANVQIFWDPKGVELDSLGAKTKSGDPADGDTPYIRMPIRMLGIDTPETNYLGGETTANTKLLKLKDFLESGNFDAWIDKEVRNYLIPKLEGAGTLQIKQGIAAKEYFEQILDQRLTKPNGRKRNLFVRAADEHFDRYGRLLAYVAPNYSKGELAAMGRRDRKTFNLELVESGWAATIMIYPNLPKNTDLRLTQEAAKAAFDNKIGAWADDKMLTAYEYRSCMKLYDQCKKAKVSDAFFIKETSWISRYCIDVTTLKVYTPQKYLQVPVYNRMFVWPDNIRSAVGELNLIAAE